MAELHRLLAPLGLDMVAVALDSLLCLLEREVGRPIVIGTTDRPTPDQMMLCALLGCGTIVGETGAGVSAVECAAASVAWLAGTSPRPGAPVS